MKIACFLPFLLVTRAFAADPIQVTGESRGACLWALEENGQAEAESAAGSKAMELCKNAAKRVSGFSYGSRWDHSQPGCYRVHTTATADFECIEGAAADVVGVGRSYGGPPWSGPSGEIEEAKVLADQDAAKKCVGLTLRKSEYTEQYGLGQSPHGGLRWMATATATYACTVW